MWPNITLEVVDPGVGVWEKTKQISDPRLKDLAKELPKALGSIRFGVVLIAKTKIPHSGQYTIYTINY